MRLNIARTLAAPRLFVRHASSDATFLGRFRNIFSAEKAPAPEAETETSLFDEAKEQVQPRGSQQRLWEKATFHKYSTGAIKYSPQKLNMIANLIAGLGVDEAILQLQMLQKKPAKRILSTVALARDHAIAKGMDRSQLIVAQSWVTKDKYLQRVNPQGRGHFGIMHHPSSRLHVLLAEGITRDEKKRQNTRTKFRRKIVNATTKKPTPIINPSLSAYHW